MSHPRSVSATIMFVAVCCYVLQCTCAGFCCRPLVCLPSIVFLIVTFFYEMHHLSVVFDQSVLACVRGRSCVLLVVAVCVRTRCALEVRAQVSAFAQAVHLTHYTLHTTGENAGLARLLRCAHQYDGSSAEAMMHTLRQISLNGHRPVRELRAVAQLLAHDTPVDVLVAVCKALCDLVSLDALYRDVFRELGIVQALVRTLLERYARSDHSHGAAAISSGVLRWESHPEMRLDPQLFETLQVLCRATRQSAHLVRVGGLACLLQLVWCQHLSASVLLLLCQVCLHMYMRLYV